MLQADPSIRLSACGAPVFWGKAWNDTLIAGTRSRMQILTDHPLIGGDVPSDKEPMDVYRDFMAVPDVLAQKWAALEKDMAAAGIKDPRLEVTELQMFAHIGRPSDPNAQVRLTGETLVSPGTLAEALYDVSIYHHAVRLAPYVEMVTHSATVNHGGGLRKSRERVYANPCFYGQSMFSAWARAVPVEVTLESPKEQAPIVLPEMRNVTSSCSYTTIDPLAAISPEGRLLVSLVYRGTRQPVSLEVALRDFAAGAKAEVQTLSAEVPWAQNTLENPEAIKPVLSTAEIKNGSLRLDLKPFSLVHLSIPPRP
jgi:alpha-N-arabinofuranosidase